MMITKLIKRQIYTKLLLQNIVLVLCCSCNSYTPFTKKLTNNEIIGIWKLSAESTEFLRKEHICCSDQEIKLILSENNSFSLENMPDCWSDSQSKCAIVNSYKGKWSIDHRSGTQDWWLYLNISDEIYNRVYAVPFINRNKEIQLLFTFGDPDGEKEIYLSK